MYRDYPTGAIVSDFGEPGDIAHIITHAKFAINGFRGFGVLTLPFLPFYIGLAGRRYNGVSSTVLHCDSSFVCLSVHPLLVLC